MQEISDDDRQKRLRGERAEQVAAWYFRLNGFLSIPGFIVHIDSPDAEVRDDSSLRHARTEADFIGVRFPHSCEIVNSRTLQDDALVIRIGGDVKVPKPLFVLVEVKAGECKMNGPWSNPMRKNMERVIRRLGFAAQEQQVEGIAQAMYSDARWESQSHILQYICVGMKKDRALSAKYRHLVQIDWSDIGNFLLERFGSFPEKLPSGHVHEQWPDFGRKYGEWFVCQGSSVAASDSTKAVKRFIDTGLCIHTKGAGAEFVCVN